VGLKKQEKERVQARRRKERMLAIQMQMNLRNSQDQ